MLFLANLSLHGLSLWQDPPARGCAQVIGLTVLGATAVIVRRGLVSRRLVVEVQEDQRRDGRTVSAVTAAGQPAVAEVRLRYSEGEQCRQETPGSHRNETLPCG